MNIYYTNKNINCDGDGVTGSQNLLTVKREGMKDYNCIIDFGMVQSSKLKSEQLYKINSRPLQYGGDAFPVLEINDVILSHAHA